MLNEVDVLEFISGTNQTFGDPTSFRHKVIRGKLINDNRTWVCKEAFTAKNARMEALAQEFFRLIIPYQPETRVARNWETEVFYILSQEVPQFKDFPRHQFYKFENGRYSGLAEVLVTSIFLQETDIKDGNIGLDNLNRVVKVDGDWCFTGLFHSKSNCYLTPEVIKKLPYIDDQYFVYNWLDTYNQGVKNPKQSDILSPLLSQSLAFKKGTNQALLRLLSIPDYFIEAFVDAYIPSCAMVYSDYLIKRRDSLRECVIELPEFVKYMDSLDAKKETDRFFKQMLGFCAGGVPVITDKMIDVFSRKFESNLQNVYNKKQTYNPRFLGSVSTRNAIDLAVDCKQLVYRAMDYSITFSDTKMDAMAREYIALINKHEHNPKELLNLHDDLCTIINSASKSFSYLNSHPSISLLSMFSHRKLYMALCARVAEQHPKDRWKLVQEIEKESSTSHYDFNSTGHIFFAK